MGRIDTACALDGRVMISPGQGARRIPRVGSLARPPPSMRPENTGSGTSSRTLHQPSTGAKIYRLDIRRLLPDLDPIDRPQWIQPWTRETQTQIVQARQARRLLGRQLRHAFSAGRRRQRQDGERRGVATVDMNLEF